MAPPRQLRADLGRGGGEDIQYSLLLLFFFTKSRAAHLQFLYTRYNSYRLGTILISKIN